MAALRARFIADAASEAAALSQALAQDKLEDGRQQAHSLAGRSAMFGFSELGDVALAADEASDRDLRARLEALLQALQRVGHEP